ncbi:MAG: hypothetical protein GXP45_03960 [bacterium]|nr:hypothetical protein [bacterium]
MNFEQSYQAWVDGVFDVNILDIVQMLGKEQLQDVLSLQLDGESQNLEGNINIDASSLTENRE